MHGGLAHSALRLRCSWRRRRRPPDERVDVGVGLGGVSFAPPPRFACYLQLVVLVGILTTSIA